MLKQSGNGIYLEIIVLISLGHLYGKIPAIWERMAIDRHVNSNYGYQWERNYQLDYVIAKLKHDKDTRHAAISIYDGKEHADVS